MKRRVAPARERGLKSRLAGYDDLLEGRSREGAWIEIYQSRPSSGLRSGRSREGAWIEIVSALLSKAQTWRRSREGAWIEMPVTALHLTLASVAPARERGLKSAWTVMR